MSENRVSIEGSPIRYELFRSESAINFPAQTVKEASQTLMSRRAVTRMESDVDRKMLDPSDEKRASIERKKSLDCTQKRER